MPVRRPRVVAHLIVQVHVVIDAQIVAQAPDNEIQSMQYVPTQEIGQAEVARVHLKHGMSHPGPIEGKRETRKVSQKTTLGQECENLRKWLKDCKDPCMFYLYLKVHMIPCLMLVAYI